MEEMLPAQVFLIVFTLVDFHLKWLNWFWFLILATSYSNSFHDFSITVPRRYKDVYVNSFFPRTARPWNSVHVLSLDL